MNHLEQFGCICFWIRKVFHPSLFSEANFVLKGRVYVLIIYLKLKIVMFPVSPGSNQLFPWLVGAVLSASRTLFEQQPPQYNHCLSINLPILSQNYFPLIIQQTGGYNFSKPEWFYYTTLFILVSIFEAILFCCFSDETVTTKSSLSITDSKRVSPTK